VKRSRNDRIGFEDSRRAVAEDHAGTLPKMEWQKARLVAAELAKRHDGLAPGTPVEVIQYASEASYLRENPVRDLRWQDHVYVCQALKRELSRRKLKVNTILVE
jgi:hypothetical protein